MATLAALTSLKVSRHQIPQCGLIPNTSIQNRPLLIYHQAFDPQNITPSAIEAHVRSVGSCEPQWRYPMYRTTHFHSTTHELLVVFRGGALLLFGGEDNPGRVEVEARKGDAILIPAGVAHKLVEEGPGGFEMVGSYPRGAASWDMCYGAQGEDVDDTIRGVEWFHKDPLYGQTGPATDAGEGRDV